MIAPATAPAPLLWVWVAFFLSACFVTADIHIVLTTVVLVAAMLFRRGVDYSGISSALPLCLIVIPALAITIAAGEVGWIAVKSIAFILRVPIYIVFGMTFCPRGNGARTVLLAALIAGVVAAVKYAAIYFYSPDANMDAREEIRSVIGRGYFIWCIAACAGIYFYLDKRIVPLRRHAALGAVAMILFAAILSSSRSVFLNTALIGMVIAGLIPLRRLRLLALTGLIVAALVTTPALPALLGESLVSEIDSVAPDSLREVLPIRRSDPREINQYWRGHEATHAYALLEADFPGSLLFGTGLHTQAKLVLDRLGQYYLIPTVVFHNGFAFLLLRGGLFGIGLYLIQILLLVRDSRRLSDSCSDPTPETRLYARIMGGLVLIAVISTPTVAGLINNGETGATMGLVFGCGLSLSRRRRRLDVVGDAEHVLAVKDKIPVQL